MIDGSKSHFGFFALIGAPNVGKSTLINSIVGSKISIVSPKVQTTRTRILGITVSGKSQIVFIDTPGIFKPKHRLDRAMVNSAWIGVSEADKVLLLVDAMQGYDNSINPILNRLKKQNKKIFLAINKIDQVKKTILLDLASRYSKTELFSEIFMLSAKSGDGVGYLINKLIKVLPEGPWMFPKDQISTMPSRLLAAEITREKIYLQLHQELPYAISVETERWEEVYDQSVKIHQVIYVKKSGQKSIVLGKNGKKIKKIGELSRRELEEILGQKVHLFLFVKVKENWSDRPDHYVDWGLDFNA